MNIKIRYDFPRDKYLIKLTDPPAVSVHVGAYKSVRGVMRKVDQLRAEGHMVDPKELDKIALGDF